MKFDYLKEVMGGRLEGGADVSGDGEVIAGKCRGGDMRCGGKGGTECAVAEGWTGWEDWMRCSVQPGMAWTWRRLLLCVCSL